MLRMLLGFVFLIFCGVGNTQNFPYEELESFVKKALEDFEAPGVALCVVEGENILFSKGFGFRNVEQKLPVTEDTLFAIGSTTKAFTTFLMECLVEDGHLDLDLPLHLYLPSFCLYDSFTTDSITPRDLVCHLSGIPRHDFVWYRSDATLEQMVNSLEFLENHYPLRTHWEYNNLLYAVSGYLVERILKKSWEESVQEKILEPLQMRRTNFCIKDFEKDSNYALPYVNGVKKLIPLELYELCQVGPALSMNASVKELSFWVRMLLQNGVWEGKRLISSERLKEIFSPQVKMNERQWYGLGWILDFFGEKERIFHTGAVDGFTAQITMFLKDSLGIIVLCNQEGSFLPSLITDKVVNQMLGTDAKTISYEEALSFFQKEKQRRKEAQIKQNYRMAKPIKASRVLEEYVGEYEHPSYGKIAVFLEKNTLRAFYHQMTFPLHYVYYDTFILENDEKKKRMFDGMQVIFFSGLSGKIQYLEMPLEPKIDPIIFVKKKEKM